MAPAKRKADKQAEEAEAAQPTTLPPSRVTRASAKRAATAPAASTGPPAVSELPVKKNKKAKGTQKKKKEEEAEEKVEDALSETEEGEGDSATANGVDTSKTIIIEHCKQCNSFKTRANQVKAGLEKTAGVTVIVNPEKPRRGCFEIREEGGKKFISLLDMKRPFTPMKNLDMDKVISDIIDGISTTG